MNGDRFGEGMNNFGINTSMVSNFLLDPETLLLSIFQDSASEEISLASRSR